MDDIIKIVKSLENADLLIKDVSKTNKNEANKEKQGFLGMLLGTLGASLLGNLLTGKEMKCSNIPGQGVMPAGEGTSRAGQNF